jgi:Asp-tRNA(Asn)/Glu-tRNA(Gln) amidotransferase C subunit
MISRKLVRRKRVVIYVYYLDDMNTTEMDNSIMAQNEETQKKFIQKIQRILEYLEKVNISFPENEEENPRMLLLSLKNEKDVKEKNKIIDKLEKILTTAMKDYNL